jgi:hypothetical protein
MSVSFDTDVGYVVLGIEHCTVGRTKSRLRTEKVRPTSRIQVASRSRPNDDRTLRQVATGGILCRPSGTTRSSTPDCDTRPRARGSWIFEERR